MKHTGFLAALAVILLVSCTKDSDPIQPPVEKTSKFIQFSLAQSKDYYKPEFQGLRAGVTITVSKIIRATGQSIIMWDSAIGFQPITDYPVPHHPYTFGKVFYNIDDVREKLSLSYWIVYRDRHDRFTGEGMNQFAEKAIL